MNMSTTEKAISHAKPKAPKKAKPTPAEQVAKMRQASIDLAPPPEELQIINVPVDLIDCKEQVRKKFNESALAELADDITARGVMQPVLLRPHENGRYLMIAGERRLRASRIAQKTTVPAIIQQIGDATAEDMQLAENIQREELNLADTAAAVRRIYNHSQSVTETAAKVRKSKSWVSKHLAIANGLNPQAAKLLTDGITEDLETLKAVSDLEPLATGTNSVWALCENIRAGKAGRTEARERLAAAKDAADPIKQAERQRQKDTESKAREEQLTEQNAVQLAAQAQRETAEKAAIERDPRRFLWMITMNLENPEHQTPQEMYDSWSLLQQARVKEHLDHLHAAGQGSHGKPEVLLSRIRNGDYGPVELAAFIAGFTGQAFDPVKFMAQVKQAHKLNQA